MAGKPQFKLRPLRFENLEQRRLLAGDLGSFHNVVDPEDVDVNGRVNVVDAFMAIEEVRQGTHGALGRMADANADGYVSIVDPFQIINRIREGGETRFPVDVRIERLTAAIENGNLPGQVSEENANRLLARLETRQLEISAELGQGESDPNQGDQSGRDGAIGGPNFDPTDLIDELVNRGGDGGEAEYLDRLADRFANLDANNDGSLTTDEVHDFKWERLIQQDGDANLMISLEEFTEAINNHWQEHREQIGDRFDVFAIFDRVDANSDGGITEDEFPSPEGWEEIVKADANGDASLTETELLDYAEQLANENLDLLFSTLDIDGSGEIDPEDVQLGWFWLQRADEDDSGSISSSEWAASIGSLPARVRERLNQNRA